MNMHDERYVLALTIDGGTRLRDQKTGQTVAWSGELALFHALGQLATWRECDALAGDECTCVEISRGRGEVTHDITGCTIHDELAGDDVRTVAGVAFCTLCRRDEGNPHMSWCTAADGAHKAHYGAPGIVGHGDDCPFGCGEPSTGPTKCTGECAKYRNPDYAGGAE